MVSFIQEVATTPSGRNIFACVSSCLSHTISLNHSTGLSALFITRGGEAPNRVRSGRKDGE